MFTARDYQKLVTKIYDTAINGQWSSVLNDIMTMLNANKAFFFLQDLSEESPIYVNMQCNFDYPAKALIEYQSRPLEDPLYHVTKTITQGDALNINQFMDISQHEGSEYFENVLEPMKSYYAMAGILKRDGLHEAPFAVARWKDQGPFTDSELALMKRLTTHLSRAMTIFIDLQTYRKKNTILSSILDGQDSAQFICSSGGQILHHNNTAMDYLSVHQNILSLDGVLSLKHSILDTQLKQYMSHCCSLSIADIEMQHTLTIQTDNTHHAVINVSPCCLNSSEENHTPKCIVIIKLKRDVDISSFAHEFGLTRAESHLIEQVLTEKKLSVLAQEIGKSHQTLRNQMQSIYRKCGVDSQISLMSKLNLF